LLLHLNISGQVLEMQQKIFSMCHNIIDCGGCDKNLLINVKCGKIPVSCFVKLVCVLVVRVVRVDYKLLYMAENYK